MKAVLYRLIDGKIEEAGEIFLDGSGKVVSSGEIAARVLQSIESGEARAILLGDSPKEVTVADGEQFLRALPYTFRSPYFWVELEE